MSLQCRPVSTRRHGQLWLTAWTALTIATSAPAVWANAHEDAQILAGVKLIDAKIPEANLKARFESAPSLFHVTNASAMRQFFAREIPRTQKTRNLIYLFGGPDALFPQVIFPRYEKMLLVGLEPAGELADISAMSPAQRQQEIVKVAQAYGNSLRNSYFITSHMAKDLAEKGTTTIIATGLAVQGFEILAIERVSLAKNGQVLMGLVGDVKGVKISFARGDRSRAEIYYFQYDLSDQNMERKPELSLFIQQNQFDTAFYKAASFVSHNANFKRINSLVLDQVSLLLQADDGIPFSALAAPERAKDLTLTLYGQYTAPHAMFGVSTQRNLKSLFGQEICASGRGQDWELWQRVWNTDPCAERSAANFRRARWAGYLPFRFGYAAVSGPEGILPEAEETKFGTLMVFEK